MVLGFIGLSEGCADHVSVVDSTGSGSGSGSEADESGGKSGTPGGGTGQLEMPMSGGAASIGSGGTAPLNPNTEGLDALVCEQDDPYCVVNWLGQAEQPGVVSGNFELARLSQARGITIYGSTAYLSLNHAIFKIDLETRETVLLAGAAESGRVDGDLASARFNQPSGIVATEHELYVADTGNRRIAKLDLATAQVSTYLTALVSAPQGLLLREGPQGSAQYLLIADEILHIVLQVDLTLAAPIPGILVGEHGTAGNNSVRLNQPFGLATIADELFITERGNHTVRRVDLSRVPPLTLMTVWGLGQPGYVDGGPGIALLNDPRGILSHENELIVIDSQNSVLRRGSPGGTLQTVVGQAQLPGHAQGPGDQASLLFPQFAALAGPYLYLSDDTLLRRIRL
jgi:hypothetical protein